MDTIPIMAELNPEKAELKLMKSACVMNMVFSLSPDSNQSIVSPNNSMDNRIG